ncbi:hypothetical protein [Enterobacter asburiae]|uniref:hypothetical protein n=1 Tax=Enterobacter asburiae TaxID=61645 RepID=UPI0028121367|nr:hypothetical protein [Enterobacter asburiae]WMQ95788.1 hypothetical protein RCR44_18375 [Enterobacter asburiae]WMR00562.1 hypothetical protein RCR45_18245 [Enterobacter asburiae]
MKLFKGLSLHPHDAFKNIGVLIEAAGILTCVTDEEYQELSDVIIELCRKYAKVAEDIELEKLK